MTAKAGSEGTATVLFWLTVAGTVMHGTRLALDAWVTWSQLPRLQRIAEGRDKSFDPSATDADVVLFASRCGREVRYVNLKDAAAITDEGVIALAASCPHIQRLVLSDCSLLTDNAIVAVARACLECHQSTPAQVATTPRLANVKFSCCVESIDKH